MAASPAVKIALEIWCVPSRVKAVVADPLPEGVGDLLAIAAGDRESLERAALACERSTATVSEAAKFFVEQILLGSNSDSYRVLGATPDTSTADLRRNMANLVKWLHPDAGVIVDRPAAAGRVNQAWDDLKTPDRRMAYDVAHPRSKSTGHKPSVKKRRAILRPRRYGDRAQAGTRSGAGSRLRRALMLLLGREVL